jgi:hypothetical protein
VGADEATAALRPQQHEPHTPLAWVLPAAPASAGARERLLGRLQGDETVRVERPLLEGGAAAAVTVAPGPLGVLDPPAMPAWASAPAPDGGPAATAAPTAPGAPRGAAPAIAGQPRRPGATALSPSARRSYRWALPLAAVFALAAVGLGLHDRQLARQLDDTEQALGAARREKQQLADQLRSGQGDGAKAAALQGRMDELEAQLRLVTTPGTAFCRLGPTPGTPAHAAAGLLYVAADHQHWFLRARNLPAPGPGRAYQLWFLVGQRPVRAGSFELAGDEAVLSSPTMPEGTTAAMVTIEPAEVAGDRPSGPVILYGRDMAAL